MEKRQPLPVAFNPDRAGAVFERLAVRACSSHHVGHERCVIVKLRGLEIARGGLREVEPSQRRQRPRPVKDAARFDLQLLRGQMSGKGIPVLLTERFPHMFFNGDRIIGGDHLGMFRRAR